VPTIDIKPPQHLKLAGGFNQRARLGRIWRRMIVRDAGLPRNGAVLDVGCGLGRMAVPLADYLGRRGRYEGMDVDAEAIQWCQSNIASVHPNFQFRAVNVRSGRYNPDGSAAAGDFEFPYPDATFDVVFLASVFTHLLPAAVARYLGEIARVLKPGGRCLASYFLINANSERAIEEDRVKPLLRFPERRADCRLLSAELPESAVAHYEDAIRQLYRNAALALVEPIRYGNWTGADSPSGQDIVLAVRGPSAA
jgi:ubiquinone/menaquinone biosynthesis C-methylase UbiE